MPIFYATGFGDKPFPFCRSKVSNIGTSEEAFNILEKVRPDLILLDVVMPVMDGYEMIKILKKSSQFKSIPVHLLLK